MNGSATYRQNIKGKSFKIVLKFLDCACSSRNFMKNEDALVIFKLCRGNPMTKALNNFSSLVHGICRRRFFHRTPYGNQFACCPQIVSKPHIWIKVESG